MADRQLAGQRGEVVLLEDLADEAQLPAGDDLPAVVGGRDPRRLLTAVLKRVEGEVGETGDVVIGRVDPEHTALVTRSVAQLEVDWRSFHRGSSRRADRFRTTPTG